MNSGLRGCFLCSFLAKSKVQAFAIAELKVITGTNLSPGCSMVIIITVNRVLFMARFLYLKAVTLLWYKRNKISGCAAMRNVSTAGWYHSTVVNSL